MLSCIFDCLPSWGTIVVSVLTFCLVYEYRKQKGLPPGPYGLPFMGFAFWLDRPRMAQQLESLCEKYKTDILSFTIFGQTIIVLNDIEITKELYQKRSDFADRPSEPLFKPFNEHVTGVIATSGKVWREARRFSISMLRDFGMGRMGAEDRIQHEADYLIQAFKNEDKRAFDLQEYVNVAVANVICGMVFGERFDADDKEFREALRGINNFLVKMNTNAMFFALQFRIGRILFREGFQELKDNFKLFEDFIAKKTDEHKRDYDGQVTDLIHGFLKEVEEKSDPEIFNDHMLKSLIMDYFVAGSESTYTTLRWAFLSMAKYPEIQKKVQDELDQLGSLPNIEEKKNTPYTEAVLNEILRYYTLVPLGGPPHTTNSENVVYNGYRLPKNCLVMSNFHKIHHDKKTWKNPEEFDPENFYEDGRVVNTEKIIPFGIGRRSCAGEALARMELYILFARIVKEFDILPEEGKEMDEEGINGLVYQPKPFKVRMMPRQ